jgi:hypothetical protein
MKVSIVPIDSETLGRTVLALSDISLNDNISEHESEYVAKYRPAYVYTKIPLDRLAIIHLLESAGFSFVECQLRLLVRLNKEFDTSQFRYEYKRISEPSQLEDALCIAKNAFVHDRFFLDPNGTPGFSGRRFEAYLRQSFASDVEEVWHLVDLMDNKTVAFRSHRRTSENEALLLLGGVTKELQSLGLGVISSYFCLNQLKRDGYRRAITHISLVNKPIFDVEVTHLGFRYEQSFAVLRKIYK